MPSASLNPFATSSPSPLSSTQPATIVFGSNQPGTFGSSEPAMSALGSSQPATSAFAGNQPATSPFGAYAFGSCMSSHGCATGAFSSTTSLFGTSPATTVSGNNQPATSALDCNEPDTSAFASDRPATSIFGSNGLGVASSFGSATGVFGAPQPSFGSSTQALGAQSLSSPFGTSSNSFGGNSNFIQTKPSSALGLNQSKPSGTGSQPSFGSSAAAFGSLSAPASGSSAAPVFGSSGAPAIGSSTGQALGTSSASAFGSNTPALGTSSTPAFGSTPAVFAGAGTSPPALGGSPFGSGNILGGQKGTRGHAFVPTLDTEAGGQGILMSLTAMSAYKSNSFEELRWEDYQAGDKGGPKTAAATGEISLGQLQTNLFGSSTPSPSVSPSPSPSPFGGGSQGTSPFGSGGSSFGGSALGGSALGSSSQPFGTATTSSSSGQSSSSLFGQSTVLGQSQSLFGKNSSSTFGQSTSPAFGQTSYLFFAKSSTPAFGQSSTSLFGQSSTAPFGQSSTSLFGQSSSSLFGQSSSSLFGQSSSSPFGQSSIAPFGQSSTSPFGQSSSTSPFGQSSTSPFGQSSTSPFGQSSTSPFGQSSTSPFGQSFTSLFGQSSTSPLATPSSGQNSVIIPFAHSSVPFGQGLSPSFGQNSNLFGPASSLPPPFGMSSSTPSSTLPSNPPSFGFLSTSPFGSTPASGSSSTPSVGLGVFSQSTASGISNTAGTSPFSFATSSQHSGSTPSFLSGFSSSVSGQSLGAPSLSVDVGGTKAGGLSQAISTPTFSGFGASSSSGQGLFNFSFPASQTSQGSSPFGSSNVFGSSFGQLSQAQSVQSSQQTGSQTPQSPFGSPPLITNYQLGQTGGSNQGVPFQYGISSLPVTEKQAPSRSTSSLLTPKHITPRSKVRMHARRYHQRPDAPRVVFSSDEEVTFPKVENNPPVLIPPENSRALFGTQSENLANPFPSQPDSGVREKDTTLPNGVEVQPNNVDVQANHVSEVSDTEKKESFNDVIEESPIGVPTPVRVSTTKKMEPNGVHPSEHVYHHRGNGYASMTGHRAGEAAIAYEFGAEVEALMPKLRSNDYYTEPRIQDLAAKESAMPGYCKRVPNFTVGRKNYGYVRWLGDTDVRGLDLEAIIEFRAREVLCYMADETKKPAVGQGLNKPAHVTLLQVKCVDKRTQQTVRDGAVMDAFVRRLKSKLDEQGANHVSYDAYKEEWKFDVEHFSGYGLGADDDETERAQNKGKQREGAQKDGNQTDGNQKDRNQKDADQMEENQTKGPQNVQGDSMEGVEEGLGFPDDGMGLVPVGMDQQDNQGFKNLVTDEAIRGSMQTQANLGGISSFPLVHALPFQKGLDPIRMQQERSVLFPAEDVTFLPQGGSYLSKKTPGFNRRSSPSFMGRASSESPLKLSSRDSSHKDLVIPEISGGLSASERIRSGVKMGLSFSANKRRFPSLGGNGVPSPARSGPSMSLPVNKGVTYVSKFYLKGFTEAPDSVSSVRNKPNFGSDSGLFFGRSFRVGWGPDGKFVHAGMRMGGRESENPSGLSSRILVQRVALDHAVRNKDGEVRGELIQSHLIKPLVLHGRLSHTRDKVPDFGPFQGKPSERLWIREVKCSKQKLVDVCENYKELAGMQGKFSKISSGHSLLSKHHKVVWGLAQILFRDWETGQKMKVNQKGEEEAVVEGSPALIESPPTTRNLEEREMQDVEDINEGDDAEMEGMEEAGREEEARREEEEKMSEGEEVQERSRVAVEEVREEEEGAFVSAPSTILPREDRLSPDAAFYLHRAEVSKWIEACVADLVDRDISKLSNDGGLSAILTYMTGHRLYDACMEAFEGGNVHLACLLGALRMSKLNQGDVSSQLKDWDENRVIGIEPELKKLYLLCGGKLDLALEGRSLDWKRYLGSLMWYQLDTNVHFGFIFRTFESLVNEGKAPQPIPMYVEEGREYGAPPPLSEAVYDICYYLMLLHTNSVEGVKMERARLSNVFRSATFTFDWLDAQLGWHLHSILEAVGAIEPGGLHALHMNFASQLLAVQRIDLAIYVILHMPPVEGREGFHDKVVKEILNLYCPVWKNSVEQRAFMQDTLMLPSTWLHAAQALYWKYEGDREKEFQHLLGSAQWLDAHRLFVEIIATKLFFEGREEELRNHVELMERHNEVIDEWERGGRVFFDYFKLKDAFSDSDFTYDSLDTYEKRRLVCENLFDRFHVILEAKLKPISVELRLCMTTLLDEISTLFLEDTNKNQVMGKDLVDVHLSTLNPSLLEDTLFGGIQSASDSLIEWLAVSG